MTINRILMGAAASIALTAGMATAQDDPASPGLIIDLGGKIRQILQ